jgi:AraC-like DNA-binding protein
MVDSILRRREGFRNQFLFVLPPELRERYSRDPIFRSLLVTDIGYFPNALGHFVERPEGFNSTIVKYCHRGRGFYSFAGGEERAVSQGQVFVIPPGVPHCYGSSDDEPWSIYWVCFNGDLFKPWYANIQEHTPLAVSRVMGDAIRGTFRQCFNILKGDFQSEEYFFVCQLSGTILGFCSCAGKQSEARLTQTAGTGVQRAIAFMRANINRQLSVGEILEKTGGTYRSLNEAFKQSAGLAPIDYFIRMKMEAAARDLRSTAYPVCDIAVAYGYNDPYYFSRIFKKIMGKAPSEHRRAA